MPGVPGVADCQVSPALNVDRFIRYLPRHQSLLATNMDIENKLQIFVDRDSVCAGDDTEPHLQAFAVPESITIGAFLVALDDAHFLASIQGGAATWLIDCQSPNGARCIGVAAQQWPAPRLLVPADTPVLELLDANRPALYFRYRLQTDPDEVLASLETGRPLPRR
jgi:hypothetical protein